MKNVTIYKLYNYMIESFLISINLAIYLDNIFTNLVWIIMKIMNHARISRIESSSVILNLTQYSQDWNVLQK